MMRRISMMLLMPLGLAVGCGPGTSSIAPRATGTASPTPIPTASPSPVPAPSTTSTATLPVGGKPATARFAPLANGMSGSITLPGTTSGSGTVTAVLSADAPAGGPVLQMRMRMPSTPGGSVPQIKTLAYITLTATAADSFASGPSFAFDAAGPLNAAMAPNTNVAVYDPFAGWRILAGPAIVVSSTLTFTSTYPFILTPQESYLVALFTYV